MTRIIWPWRKRRDMLAEAYDTQATLAEAEQRLRTLELELDYLRLSQRRYSRQQLWEPGKEDG